jgi:aldehyde dehydrogenase (NAD+)
MLTNNAKVAQERTSIREVFDRQMAHYLEAGATTVRQRIALLRRLEKTLLEWRPRIREALYADMKKPANTVDMVDIYYVLREIRHTT